MITTQLFNGRTLKLCALDPEQDSAAISAWTYDLDLARFFTEDGVPHPLSAFEVKKKLAGWVKKMAEGDNAFYFAVRAREGDRLVGLLRFPWVSWPNGTGVVQLLLGDRADWPAFADDLLGLALEYAFLELNLYRVAFGTVEYRADQMRTVEDAGFTLEVRQREMIYREGRAWDTLIYGMTRDEWLAKNEVKA